MAWYGDYGRWKPYVPVAQRRAKAAGHAARVAKKEKRELAPVEIEGLKIARSFWGQAWCQHLERYSDYANRLPRGRTYVRNGSVVDLQIARGKIEALVAGSEVYTVTVSINTLEKAAWKRIKRDCSQSIDSLIDLLQGRFDKGIMQRLTERDAGLFPKPAEIKMQCSCPDWAGLCKHVAAVLYGVGARLDVQPRPPHGVVEAVDAAGIGAGDDHEVRVLPRRNRRPHLGGHYRRLDQALAGKVAAAFWQLLIF